MSDHDLATLLAIVLLVAGIVGLRETPCQETCCAHKAALLRAEKAARQRAEQHDAEHRGFGWREGDADRFRCHDTECPRNPK